jgi:hypothetical protein
MGILLYFPTPDEIFNSDHHDRSMPYALGSNCPFTALPMNINQNVQDWLGEDGEYHFSPTLI